MINELGPEAVIEVRDSKIGLHAVLVVDNTVLGPAGGGARMMPDISIDEVADLARGMTFKFAIMGLPRGGSKAGIFGDPMTAPERKREIMRGLGRRVAPMLRAGEVAIGPDMGVSVGDVAAIYEGAGVANERSGLFAQLIDGDPAAYHFTGYGVACAARAAATLARLDFKSCSVAIEGFGQVGVGTARYAERFGAKVVAVTTLRGGVYDPAGLDVERLMVLRREVGDECVKRYEGGQPIESGDIYYLPADVLVPGARPYVINAFNAERIKAKVVCPAANIALTQEAENALHARGVLSVPDYIANAGGALASWVDFLSGTPEQAIRAIDHRIGEVTSSVVSEAVERGVPPRFIAERRVNQLIQAAPRTRKSFDEIREEIQQLFASWTK